MSPDIPIEKLIETLVNQYFYKLLFFFASLLLINWLKDLVALLIARSKLMSEQIVNIDNEIEVDGVRGRVVKIGLTHIKIESEDGIYFIPIKLVTDSSITKKAIVRKVEHIIEEKNAEKEAEEESPQPIKK